MSAVPRPVRRVFTAGLAAVAVAAGLPLLAGAAANAAATGDLTLTGSTRGSAGSCLRYTLTPTDAFGGPATDTGTVVVRITENPPNDSAQDVDFCRPGNVSTPAISPHYVNASAAKRFYVAGPTLTSEVTANKTKTSLVDTGTGADNPDVASPSTPVDRANPSGQDTALYTYDGRQGASTVITFGVAGLVPGGAKVEAFRSADGDETQNSGDLSRTLNVTYSAGGLPDSTEAADAVTTVKATPATSFSPQGGPAHSFSVQLSNSAGDGVSGATPVISATTGPNAPSTATPAGTFTASCTRSGNDGVSTCSYAGQRPGADSVSIFVNQTRSRTPNPTLGLDSNEPRDVVSVTTTAPISAARFVDLTPTSASATAGGSQAFTATVTNVDGVVVGGVGLAFSETGPGSIQNGAPGAGTTTTLNASTDSTGRATVTITTTTSERGADAITVGIRNPSATACQSGTGRCTDNSTLTINGPPPPPSPTPTPTPTPACAAAVTTLPVDRITATGLADVVVSATRGSTVDLYAYSQPSTSFAVVRSGVVGQDGTVRFQVRPPSNTRLYGQQRGCPAGPSVVLNVRTALTIAVVRNGTRDYTFSGNSLPARPVGLIVSIYRIAADGSPVLAAQVRADGSTGRWSIRRAFSSSGRFGFVTRTGQDLVNAPGSSNVRSLLVY